MEGEPGEQKKGRGQIVWSEGTDITDGKARAYSLGLTRAKGLCYWLPWT